MSQRNPHSTTEEDLPKGIRRTIQKIRQTVPVGTVIRQDISPARRGPTSPAWKVIDQITTGVIIDFRSERENTRHRCIVTANGQTPQQLFEQLSQLWHQEFSIDDRQSVSDEEILPATESYQIYSETYDIYGLLLDQYSPCVKFRELEGFLYQLGYGEPTIKSIADQLILTGLLEQTEDGSFTVSQTFPNITVELVASPELDPVDPYVAKAHIRLYQLESESLANDRHLQDRQAEYNLFVDEIKKLKYQIEQHQNAQQAVVGAITEVNRERTRLEEEMRQTRTWLLDYQTLQLKLAELTKSFDRRVDH